MHVGGARRWRIRSTTLTLHSQRAQPSPLWSKLCWESRIGSGLARIAQIRCGKAPCGVGIACPPPRTARRGATREGKEVEGATLTFLPLVRHRAGVVVRPNGHTISPPLWGRSLHSDPCGRLVRPIGPLPNRDSTYCNTTVIFGTTDRRPFPTKHCSGGGDRDFRNALVRHSSHGPSGGLGS